MVTTIDKQALLFELHQAQDERTALIAKRLALSERVITGLPNADERAAWYAEREEVDRAIDEILRKIEILLEAMQE
ncbi:MAG TPA: hypothetical protein VK034_05515 [Enhygromyxa sp.]|nr:hypothetical protein [Enhygromyxa sp.]